MRPGRLQCRRRRDPNRDHRGRDHDHIEYDVDDGRRYPGHHTAAKTRLHTGWWRHGTDRHRLRRRRCPGFVEGDLPMRRSRSSGGRDQPRRDRRGCPARRRPRGTSPSSPSRASWGTGTARPLDGPPHGGRRGRHSGGCRTAQARYPRSGRSGPKHLGCDWRCPPPTGSRCLDGRRDHRGAHSARSCGGPPERRRTNDDDRSRCSGDRPGRPHPRARRPFRVRIRLDGSSFSARVHPFGGGHGTCDWRLGCGV